MLGKTFDRSRLYPRCVTCGKGAVLGTHKPHSQKRTKRIVGANIQTYFGMPLCTRCRRTARHEALRLA